MTAVIALWPDVKREKPAALTEVLHLTTVLAGNARTLSMSSAVGSVYSC
jgi:hypothetical protein